MSKNELIITYDKIEAICYRYLCWAKIRVEFTKDDNQVPYYVITGKDIKELQDKLRAAKDTHMSGKEMEKGLLELEAHTEKLKSFLLGGES